MRNATRAITWVAVGWAVVVGLVALYFADNIRGYYRFKELCAKEGGLHVLHRLEKGAGWSGREGDFAVAALEGVAFFRFVDKNGETRDVRYRGGPVGDERSYRVSKAEETVPVRYALKRVAEDVPTAPRTSRSGFEVREVSTGRVMVRWYQIGYSTFNQDRTLLGAPSGNFCHPWGDFYAPENQTKYFNN